MYAIRAAAPGLLVFVPGERLLADALLASGPDPCSTIAVALWEARLMATAAWPPTSLLLAHTQVEFMLSDAITCALVRCCRFDDTASNSRQLHVLRSPFPPPHPISSNQPLILPFPGDGALFGRC